MLYYQLAPNSNSFKKYKKVFVYTKSKNRNLIDDSDKVWQEYKQSAKIVKNLFDNKFDEEEFKWVKKKAIRVK